MPRCMHPERHTEIHTVMPMHEYSTVPYIALHDVTLSVFVFTGLL